MIGVYQDLSAQKTAILYLTYLRILVNLMVGVTGRSSVKSDAGVLRAPLVHAVGVVSAGVGFPKRRQLIERFPEILHQCGRGVTALKLFLRPSVSHSSGLDFQEALLTRGQGHGGGTALYVPLNGEANTGEFSSISNHIWSRCGGISSEKNLQTAVRLWETSPTIATAGRTHGPVAPALSVGRWRGLLRAATSVMFAAALRPA